MPLNEDFQLVINLFNKISFIIRELSVKESPPNPKRIKQQLARKIQTFDEIPLDKRCSIQVILSGEILDEFIASELRLSTSIDLSAGVATGFDNAQKAEAADADTDASIDVALMERYEVLLPLIKTLSALEEFDDPEMATKKLATLFSSTEAAIQYLVNFSKTSHSETPLHDATLFSISSFNMIEEENEKNNWRRLAEQHLSGSKLNKSFFDVLNFSGLFTQLKKHPAFKNYEDFKKIALALPEDAKQMTPIERLIKGIWEDADKVCVRAKNTVVERELTKIKKNEKDTRADEIIRAEIEEKFTNTQGNTTRKNQIKDYLKGVASLDLKRLQTIAKHYSYTRGAENVLAASILYQMKVPEEYFDEYLDLIKQSPPQSSDHVLPSVFIDGRTVGCNGFYLVKLSANDPIGPFLGYPTGCCQSIGSEGEDCAKYGVIEENAGFYVLCKGEPSQALLKEINDAKDASREYDTSGLITPDKIVAQSWIWRSFDKAKEIYSNVVVFDNIEASDNLGLKNQNICKKMYMILAARLVKDSLKEYPIDSVHIGKTDYGLSGLGFDEYDYSEYDFSLHSKKGEYEGYTDAEDQLLLYQEKRHSFIIKLLENFREGIVNLENMDCSMDDLYFLYVMLPFFSEDELKSLLPIVQGKGEKIDYDFPFEYFFDNPNLINIVFNSLPKGKQIKLLKKEDGFGNLILLYGALYHPKALTVILDALSEEERMMLITHNNHYDTSIIHYASRFNPDSLKLLLEYLPEERRAEYILKENPTGNMLHVSTEGLPVLITCLQSSLSKPQFEALLQTPNKHGDTLMYANCENMERLKLLLNLLPSRFTAITQKNRLGRTTLLKLKDNLEHINVIMNTLTPEEQLEAFKLLNGYRNHSKQSELMTFLGIENPLFYILCTVTLSDMSEKECSSLSRFSVFETSESRLFLNDLLKEPSLNCVIQHILTYLKSEPSSVLHLSIIDKLMIDYPEAHDLKEYRDKLNFFEQKWVALGLVIKKESFEQDKKTI